MKDKWLVNGVFLSMNESILRSFFFYGFDLTLLHFNLEKE